MIFIVQIAVIFVALAIVFIALNGRRTHVGRAWKKVGLCFLAIGMVIAVTFPEITNQIAHIVGVGRGADLLLYILTLAFIVYTLNSYLYQQDEKDAMYRLARRVAVLDAVERYKMYKK